MQLFISKQTTLRRLFALCFLSSAKKIADKFQSNAFCSLQYLTWDEVVMATLYRMES